MDFKDYYATLGVNKTATEKEIKGAFRKLARKLHPDVNPGDSSAETRFKEINEAYEVLGTPETRKKYDELGANWRQYEQAQAQGTANPFAGQWTGGGAPGGFRSMSAEEMEEMLGGQSPFSDFFTTFFGGGTGGGGARGGRAGRTRQRPGRDVEHEIDLSLEEAYHGAMRRLSMTHDGQAHSVDVRIPAGISDGSRVRVPNEGEPGVGGGPAGDLYLRVRLAHHPVFERKGRDLYVTVSTPVTTAILGGETEVPTMSGKAARLKIPPLTQNGQVFRLKGYGVPAVGKPDDKGDLYARVDAQLPTQVTPEERDHYAAIQRLRAGTPSAV